MDIHTFIHSPGGNMKNYTIQTDIHIHTQLHTVQTDRHIHTHLHTHTIIHNPDAWQVRSSDRQQSRSSSSEQEAAGEPGQTTPHP